jgi:ABC-2 type transport system permease protein
MTTAVQRAGRPLPRATGLTGTGELLRLAARRDRVLIPVSIAALVFLVVGSAQATFGLYSGADAASVAALFGDFMDNPALVAMYGPVASLTLDSFATFKSVLLGAVFLCLLAYVIVRRHTRTEEEEGRLELLGAGVVGRRAALTSAVVLATATVLLTALLTTLGGIAVGLDASGSVALGVAWTIMGLAWVGTTAVAAQLTSTTRGTAGWALGALGVAFLLRALGDTAADDSPVRFLSWLSPLGWGVKVAPFGANRIELIVLGVAAYAALLAVAYTLLERRDLGAGVLPSRAGADRGTLGSAFGLTRRLARGTVIGWTVAYVVLGTVLGSIAGNVESFINSPETADMLRRLGGGAGTIIDTFFATEFHIASVAAAALAIALTTRMHTEERTTRAEAVLATPVRRTPWALGHLTVAVAASAFVMFVGALVAGFVDSGRTGDLPGTVGPLVGAALSTLPAVWVSTAVAMLIYGAFPRFTGVVWAVLISFLLLGEFGDLLDLPEWLTQLSPYAHLPSLPGGEVSWTALVVLTVVAALVGALGIGALRRRDFG